jgi:hypothetical protein
MDPVRTVRALGAFEGRGPGTDSERRAALWIVDRLGQAGRDVRLETVWVRPHWPAVHAIHATLAAAASALSVASPVAGLALGLAVAVSFAGDLTGAFFLVRRLTPERATQNLVSTARGDGKQVRLVVCAALDAPRAGAAGRAPWSTLYARLRRSLGFPPALTVLFVASILIAAFAAARLAGAEGTALGAGQLVPTLVLLTGVAVLVDLALSDASPGAGAASAAAVALALTAELDARPPRNLAVELVIAGAGQGPALGMRSYVRARRKRVRAQELAVLALEPAGAGTPRWWTHDGPLVPVRLHPQLVATAEACARDEPSLGARPLRGGGVTHAYPPRRARWPAIAIGCLDELDRSPHAGTDEDTPEHVDPAAMDAALTLCLSLVGRLDARLDRGATGP